jgi:hypothetical protein
MHSKERLSNWQERKDDDIRQRYADCNYSDMFGRKFDHPKTDHEPLIPNSVDWKDARYETRGQKVPPETPVMHETKVHERVYAIDAKQYKQQSLCTRQFEELPKPQDFTVEALEISGICDKVKLKKALEGCHVIQIDQNFDSITGQATDKAKVTLRSHGGTEAVQRQLSRAGFKCNVVVSSAARRSKYNELSNCSFLDHKTEAAANRENLNSADFRSRNQRTQMKVVGSETEHLERDPTPKDDTKSIQQWEATRKSKSVSRVMKPLADANFMKPTTAWERKQS